MTIFLCGFMGCGKTTIGKLTAKKFGCAFFDTDELIVENQGMSIPEIFAQKGEPYFRQVEADIVKSMCGKSAVISCGGGAMINSATAEYVKSTGDKIIFLDVDFDTCYERISCDSNRPIVVNNSKEQLKAIFDERHKIYLKNSTVQVNACGSPVETVEEIRRSLC